jgi:uncharacterized protein YrzB (UPF0473 family)
MSGDRDFGDDFVTISDEDGNEYELERLSEEDIEIGDRVYRAFLPVGEDDEEPYEMILFRVVEEDGEELLETIEDEAEMEEAYRVFMERLFEEDEEE